MGKTITRTMKKEAYDRKFCALLERYDTAFLVHADNVGSKQFQHIRTSLRALDTIILMGKNTMMKRCLKVYIERTGNDKWQCLYDQLLGNVGLVFTANNLVEVRKKINEFKVGAPARGCDRAADREHPRRPHRHGPVPDVVLPDAEHRHQD